jgi:hypothetical protein
MKFLLRLLAPVLALVIGVGALVLASADSGPVTCGGRDMRPTDSCVNIVGNGSTTLSYDEQRASEQRTGHQVRIAGWIFIGIGGLLLLVVLGTARSGGKARGAPAAMLKPIAADRAELARQRGWQFREVEPGVLASATTGLLAGGQQRQAKNVIAGTADGRSFAVFDFLRRAVDGPQKGQLIGTTVWQVHLPAPLPRVELWDARPMTDRKQYQPFDPAEPKGYVVRAAEAQAARRILSPQAMAVIREHGLNCVLVDGPTLISYRDGFYSAGKAEGLLVSDLEALIAVAAAMPAETSPVTSG